MSRREPAAKLLTMALAWVAIFGAGFVLFTFRDDLGWVCAAAAAEAIGDAGRRRAAKSRIPMAIDGHFWVDGEVNGETVKFLVDSGATMTTIGRSTAAARRHRDRADARDQLVRTGNGIIRVSSGRARQPEVGAIERTRLRDPRRRERQSQRAGDEFPVVARALGGRGALAGPGALMLMRYFT